MNKRLSAAFVVAAILVAAALLAGCGGKATPTTAPVAAHSSPTVAPTTAPTRAPRPTATAKPKPKPTATPTTKPTATAKPKPTAKPTVLTVPREAYVPIILTGFDPCETATFTMTVNGRPATVNEDPRLGATVHADNRGVIPFAEVGNLVPDGAVVTVSLVGTKHTRSFTFRPSSKAPVPTPEIAPRVVITPTRGVKATKDRCGTFYLAQISGFEPYEPLHIYTIEPDGRKSEMGQSRTDISGKAYISIFQEPGGSTLTGVVTILVEGTKHKATGTFMEYK